MQILIAVDLAKGGCEWLITKGARFAEIVGGKVDLLYVTSNATADQAPLDALLARIPERHRGVARALPGDVVETLVRSTNAYDVLVVGPREPGLIEMMLRGSFAMRVVREAKCAVLIPKRADPWPATPKLLGGLDLSNPRRVLEPAGRWAKRLGAKLDLVSAETPKAWEDVENRDDLERAYAHQRAETRAGVTKIVDGLDPAIRGNQRYADGNPEDVLIDLSREYDVVMVGNAQRYGFPDSLRWSIGEAVIRGSVADVLTLPSAK